MLSHTLTQPSQWSSCGTEPNCLPSCSQKTPLRDRLAPSMGTTVPQQLTSLPTGGRENASTVCSSPRSLKKTANIDYIQGITATWTNTRQTAKQFSNAFLTKIMVLNHGCGVGKQKALDFYRRSSHPASISTEFYLNWSGDQMLW